MADSTSAVGGDRGTAQHWELLRILSRDGAVAAPLADRCLPELLRGAGLGPAAGQGGCGAVGAVGLLYNCLVLHPPARERAVALGLSGTLLRVLEGAAIASVAPSASGGVRLGMRTFRVLEVVPIFV